MVARIATFEGINVQEAERTIGEAESRIRPLVEGLAGYRGSLQLLSSDGKALSITFFDSEDNVRAADQTFEEEMPRQLGDLFQSWEGQRVSVETYNVQVDSRS